MKTIKLLRLVKGMTQIDLGHAAGISASRISLLERGKVNPSSRDIERLANVLGAAKGQLMESACVQGTTVALPSSGA